MTNNITCNIESISFDELIDYMRLQAEESFPSLKNEEKLKGFAAKLHSHAEFCLCRDKDKLAGMIAFYANGQGADFAYVPHVYVSPSYRRQGLFSLMLNTTIDYVRTKGFSEIRLEVENNNIPAKESYLRLGFSMEESASQHSTYMVKRFLPVVSILVPVYQVENYIERCARSVFEQTYPNIEYIFVDDKTQDSSISTLKNVLADYPNRKNSVKVIHHEQNRGLAAARNTAVEACSGQFLLHIDSDDWLEPNAVKVLVKKQQETNADIVTPAAFLHKNGQVNKYSNRGWDLEKKELLTSILAFKISSTIWCRLIRRSLYTEHGIMCDEKGSGGEDFQVLPRLIYYAKKVTGIDTCLYHYDRSSNDSIMNNIWDKIDVQLQGLASVKVIESFFSDKEDYLKEIVFGFTVKNIHYRLRQNALLGKKEGYNTFLRLMKKSNSTFWPLVGWNKASVRFFESNFYLFRLKLAWKNKARQ